MRKYITYLFLFLAGILYSQNATLTSVQKNELINYNYSDYFAQDKTIGDFLNDIPYVNTTNAEDYRFTKGYSIYLTGLRINFRCNGELFFIRLTCDNFNHVISQKYDPNHPWDLNNLKLEKIDDLEIYDATSNEYRGIVRSMGFN